MPIYNIIASRDIVVNRESAIFYPEEINYHNNFQQLEFESLHMKNPFEWRELSDLFNKSDLKRVKTEIEQKIPFIGYFSLKPIYANTEVIKILVDFFT
ncbi:MAG: hypothetical protein HeimC3_01740 [Candidatus Heimdallarchaeota archaeon LC_3]|nr:MAG: hypothetical protein HeimC3_01740 [Candidatus Heimdallarchaeota archaeon LC_3]